MVFFFFSPEGQIDPRHRYGHNLHYYYEEWRKTDAGQPFFYWWDNFACDYTKRNNNNLLFPWKFLNYLADRVKSLYGLALLHWPCDYDPA